MLANDIVIWFWIGSHDNYERLIKSGDEDFPVGVTVHRRVGWEREEWGIGNCRAGSFGPFVLLAQKVSFGGIQRCVERQPQPRVDMH